MVVQKIRTNGFSLLEIMVAIAILAVLAAIAFPSYQSYVERTNLAAAKNELADIAAEMNTRKLRNNASYNIAGLNQLVASRSQFQSMKDKYTFHAVAVNGKDLKEGYYIYLKPVRSQFKKSLHLASSGSIYQCNSVGAANNRNPATGSGCQKVN